MDLSDVEALARIAAFLSGTAAILGAFFSYRLKLKAEERAAELAQLESDVAVSKLFSELISIANGYKGFSEPREEILAVFLKHLPDDVIARTAHTDPRVLGGLVSGSRVPENVPLAQQLAASESITNLAIRYPFLLEPALVGLDVVVGFLRKAKPASERLCRHYGVERPLTDWGFARQGPSAYQSE